MQTSTFATNSYVIIGGFPCQVLCYKNEAGTFWLRVKSVFNNKHYDLKFDKTPDIVGFTPLISTQRVVQYDNNFVYTDIGEKIEINDLYTEGDMITVLAVPVCTDKWYTKKIVVASFRMD